MPSTRPFQLMRSKYCGELTVRQAEEEVTLNGWVHRRRDHGGVIFIDLRDRTGKTQVTIDPSHCEKEVFESGETLRHEFVIGVKGIVKKRPEGMVNPKMPTGEIEVYAKEIEILSKAKPLPFALDEEVHAGENLRLKYRYLDLRRDRYQKIQEARSNAMQAARNFLKEKSFLEIETPILYKSTPEGARDYLVPSRVHHGKFYALPQSPQTLKQILMISGFDRYFQIAKCFRDEDLRADRQPEFTQIDLEMSFMDLDHLFSLMEQMMAAIWREVNDRSLETPFPRMTYQEAMERFGSDKPDTRFGFEHKVVSDLFEETEFKAFRSVIDSGGMIKAMNVRPKDLALYTRKKMDHLTETAKKYGAKGLAWLKVQEGHAFQGPVAKFFSDSEKKGLIERLGCEAGDVIFFMADKEKVCHAALSAVRLEIGRLEDLMDQSESAFLWVTDFPLFELDEESGQYFSAHHPFTQPHPEDIEKFYSSESKEWGTVRSLAYDLVLNGHELASGSYRIHDPGIQSRMFELLGMEKEEIERRFGFFVEALSYGTPPHGGMAFGLDRILMILLGLESLRDVIPFPKTQQATDLMADTPSEVSYEQLFECGIRLAKKPKADGPKS